MVTFGVLLSTQGDITIINAGWALGFWGLCVWQSVSPSKWCANTYFEYFGERSYSIYLLHPLVIIFSKKIITNVYAELLPVFGGYSFFICAFIVMIMVLIISEFTYHIIELAGIKLGRRVISSMMVNNQK